MAKRGGFVTAQMLVAGVLVSGGSTALASPAPHHDWSGVAECLTGGNWQATGITYNANGPRGVGGGYGGLRSARSPGGCTDQRPGCSTATQN